MRFWDRPREHSVIRADADDLGICAKLEMSGLQMYFYGFRVTGLASFKTTVQ